MTITTEDVPLSNGCWAVRLIETFTSVTNIIYADDQDMEKEMWVPTDLPPGPAYLGVILDVDNSVNEDIEANNTCSIPVYLVPAESRTTDQKTGVGSISQLSRK